MKQTEIRRLTEERLEREIAFLKMLESEHNNKKRLEDIRLRLRFLEKEVLK